MFRGERNQHSEPVDPFRSLEASEERSPDPLDRAKPRHWRLEGWEYSSSSSSSLKFHSMEGNEIDSSSCFEASSNSDISKESKIDRVRFRALELIMGLSTEITWLGTNLRAFSRASVADWGLQEEFIVLLYCGFCWVDEIEIYERVGGGDCQHLHVLASNMISEDPLFLEEQSELPVVRIVKYIFR